MKKDKSYAGLFLILFIIAIAALIAVSLQFNEPPKQEKKQVVNLHEIELYSDSCKLSQGDDFIARQKK